MVKQAEGTWVKDSKGWWYQYKDGSYPKSCWKQLSYNGTMEWYHFDSRGYMDTGWFTDTDGTKGAMFVNLKMLDGYQVDGKGCGCSSL